MQGGRSSNAALAEALFSLADQEPLGERRVALLRAGFTAVDAEHAAGRQVVERAPFWLKPIVSQLLSCRGEGALEAAVQRLGSGTRRRRGHRERFLTRSEVRAVLARGPAELSPQRMRGAFHWHTSDSDGKATLEVMARICMRRGAVWAMVSDHSRGLEVASGLDSVGVDMQRRRLERWNRQHGEELRLLHGLEVEVLEDGSLDVPRDERLRIDCVIAAIHRQLAPDKDQTERLLRAVSTPGVHVLAHPRCRLYHYRPGIRVRWERVFAACAEADVALEINGFPRRQDLDWELARMAANLGCTFVLASDAHAPRHLDFDEYACAIAMRADLQRRSIINTWQAEELEVWLER